MSKTEVPNNSAVNQHKKMAQGQMPKVPACPYPGKPGSGMPVGKYRG